MDSELLLAHVLGVGRLDLYLQFDRPLSVQELAGFKALLKRRAAREPLQYVVGTASFRELELRTDPRALIPRPETEVLVEEVLRWVRSREESAGSGAGTEGYGLRALDVGTGTGAIALSLLKEGGFSQVVATDPSSEALELAQENAASHALESGLELRMGSLFEPIREGERFSVIASNPPYIAEGVRDTLQAEVREWEPGEALFAGSQGLDVLLPLVREAPRFLHPQGLLALEVGEGQAGRVAQVMEEAGAFREVLIRPDLAGRERVVLGVASEGGLGNL